MNPNPQGYKIELITAQAHVQAWGEALDSFAVAIAAFEIVPGGDWRLEAYCLDPPDPDAVAGALRGAAAALGIALPPHHIAPLPPVDWLRKNREDFPALGLGRFYIHGSHIEPGSRPGRIALLVDAATAFGSGEHATTRGCLAAFERLARRAKPRRILDVGCGSGILAMGAAKLWHVPVIAADIDAEAVRVTRENVRLNRVAGLVRAGRSAGYAAPWIRRGRPYDLIAANILARPLCRMAPDLRRYLARGGVAVLSGLLVGQEAQVLAAHKAQRLALVSRERRDGWSTLVLRRRGCR